MTAVLYHVGLTVSNLANSLAFYRDVVGMTPEDVSRRAEFAGDQPTGGRTLGEIDGVTAITTRSEMFARLTNNPDAAIRSAWLRADAFALQLVEYLAGAGVSVALGHNNSGSPHFCFYVPDIEHKYAELRARGDVAIASEIIQIVPTARSFYVKDPDGLPVEFLQRS